MFGQDYNTTQWRSDFTWDGFVSLSDFVIFGQHYTHHAEGIRQEPGKLPDLDNYIKNKGLAKK
jgi:hypothetical protein